MTIVVATPYLDEAERCTRVALMHDGALHTTGTPAELRERLGPHAARSARARSSGAPRRLLAHAEGIDDVQRFGDRLDVMVRDADEGRIGSCGRRSAQGHLGDEIRPGAPTLENAFVATLARSAATRKRLRSRIARRRGSRTDRRHRRNGRSASGSEASSRR
jgi:ABC-2 type transport system ATP-binding protein